LLPVVTLSGVMGAADAAGDNGFVVVTQIGQQQFGILVDGVEDVYRLPALLRSRLHP
ncbi:MAG: hypothetical protein HC902_10415, partial [Calothrix sp. SM1_5_4]|nr:hypothetical protein [Calothrix sp. SM1_5_4]